MFKYKISATGYGFGYNTYPFEFEMTSNYDMDKDDESHERVITQAHNRIKKAFQSFGSFKIQKEARDG